MKISGICLAAIGLVLAGCAALDKPALESYDDIRAAISVVTDPATGVMTASSEPAAKEQVNINDAGGPIMDSDGSIGAPRNSQRSKTTGFVQAERQAGGATQVYFVYRRIYPVSEEQLQDRPWSQTDPDRTGWVGNPWREVPMEQVEFRNECPGSRLSCTRYSTSRLRLSSEDVKAVLGQGGKEIRFSLASYKDIHWRIDANELRAVLDALNATGEFRPAV